MTHAQRAQLQYKAAQAYKRHTGRTITARELATLNTVDLYQLSRM